MTSYLTAGRVLALFLTCCTLQVTTPLYGQTLVPSPPRGGQFPQAWPFRPVGEGLVPSRPATSEPGRAAGDKPPPYGNDGPAVMAISVTSDPVGRVTA